MFLIFIVCFFSYNIEKLNVSNVTDLNIGLKILDKRNWNKFSRTKDICVILIY